MAIGPAGTCVKEDIRELPPAPRLPMHIHVPTIDLRGREEPIKRPAEVDERRPRCEKN